MDSIISSLSSIGIIVGVVMLFNFMIFVHELGHFWAARWRGLYVDRFQIWFGKPIWKKTINGVQWGVGWIPAGGFVSLPQMAPMEAIEGEVDLPKDLKPVTPLDKIIVAAAGPLASLGLAFLFAAIVWQVGMPEKEDPVTTVGYVLKDLPGEKAGFLPGDKILKIDGHDVASWTGDMDNPGVVQRIMLGEEEQVTFLIQRPGESEPRTIVSQFSIEEKPWWQRSGMRQIGLIPASPSIVAGAIKHGPADKAGLKEGDELLSVNGEQAWSPALLLSYAKQKEQIAVEVKSSNGTIKTVSMKAEVPDSWIGKDNAEAIFGIEWAPNEQIRSYTSHPTPMAQVGKSLSWMKRTLEMVASPKSSVGMEHLTGPIGIGTYFWRLFVLDEGWKLALWFAVVLNVNLAVLNMLPLPVVDGGHVVLNTLELILKRPIEGKFLEMIQVGFVFVLLGFFVFISFKDVGDLFGGGKNKLPEAVFFDK